MIPMFYRSHYRVDIALGNDVQVKVAASIRRKSHSGRQCRPHSTGVLAYRALVSMPQISGKCGVKISKTSI